jgi:hypothetical protein
MATKMSNDAVPIKPIGVAVAAMSATTAVTSMGAAWEAVDKAANATAVEPYFKNILQVFIFNFLKVKVKRCGENSIRITKSRAFQNDAALTDENKSYSGGLSKTRPINLKA